MKFRKRPEEMHTVCGRPISDDEAPVGYHRATVEACLSALQDLVTPNEASPYHVLCLAEEAIRSLLTAAPLREPTEEEVEMVAHIIEHRDSDDWRVCLEAARAAIAAMRGGGR